MKTRFWHAEEALQPWRDSCEAERVGHIGKRIQYNQPIMDLVIGLSDQQIISIQPVTELGL
jgi:hypothetical protein